VREPVVDLLDRFPRLAAAWRGAATAGLVGDCEANPVVEGRGEQRRLAVARVAHGRDAFWIEVAVANQVIDAAMKSPCPG